MTFTQYLDREQIPVDERGPMIGYVEGFNAADPREVSAASLGAQQKAEDATGSDHNYQLRGGYDQLPTYLARCIADYGGAVLTERRSRRFAGSAGAAEVIAAPESFKAAQVVITLPLCILQSGGVTFSPQPDCSS